VGLPVEDFRSGAFIPTHAMRGANGRHEFQANCAQRLRGIIRFY
jgi:hypothetical protein